jgi:hypothetical protein
VRLIWANVATIIEQRQGLQRLGVAFEDGVEAVAICYPALSGECAVGESVLLNTTAADMELGTGGVHFVVARARVAGALALDRSSGGHIMKLRYTPLQTDVLSVESPESPHHAVMGEATSVAGMPVVCCGLHSQFPLVAAAVKRRDPSLKIAYVMTDGASLPMAMSDLVGFSAEAGLIDVTVSCGQAFGGDLEAVNLHSGLLAARLVALAHVAVVAIGPGVVGTATPFGHGGVAQGEALNAVAAVGGVPVACLRVSFADTRDRHRGVSHHSIAALGSVALAQCKVALPSLPLPMSQVVDEALERAGVWERHVACVSREGAIEPPPLMGVEVTTMGRGYQQDPAFFSAAFAAGDVAAALASGDLGRQEER